MKIQELQIGDLVHTIAENERDFIGVVESIGKISVMFNDYVYIVAIFDKENNLTTTVAIENINPILLTPEILEANGFEYDETLHRTHNGKSLYSGECIELRDCLNEYGYPIPNTYRIEVMGYEIKLLYVHQLQRALRVCGFNEEADNFKLN